MTRASEIASGRAALRLSGSGASAAGPPHRLPAEILGHLPVEGQPAPEPPSVDLCRRSGPGCRSVVPRALTLGASQTTRGTSCRIPAGKPARVCPGICPAWVRCEWPPMESGEGWSLIRGTRAGLGIRRGTGLVSKSRDKVAEVAVAVSQEGRLRVHCEIPGSKSA